MTTNKTYEYVVIGDEYKWAVISEKVPNPSKFPAKGIDGPRKAILALYEEISSLGTPNPISKESPLEGKYEPYISIKV